MKRVIRSYIFNLIALGSTSFIIEGLSFSGKFKVLAVAALVFGLVHTFVRPLLKLVSFPINFVTFGLFSFVINAFLLYAVVFIVPGFVVSGFAFEGISLGSFNISPMRISHLWTYVLASVFISFILSVLNYIRD